jgi:4-methylaminobutanoate oxidase (formaldehyde-forming)
MDLGMPSLVRAIEACMSPALPTHCRAVIIGGGVVGCSVAYHLAKLGWKDVLLLERRRLTCGTTWHAAGLIGQLRATLNMTRLAQYTAELYATLEAETGQSTGFRRTGSISVATDSERFEELKRGASMARTFWLEVEVLGPEALRQMWPLMQVGDVVGGVHLPADGQANPVDITMALARGARMQGVRIVEDVRVTAVHTAGGRVTGVDTEQGPVAAEVVVNCAGMWAREVGRLCGVNVPLHACEHYYVITEPIAGLPRDLPVLRDPGGGAYFREDTGKLLVGGFETVAKPWATHGLPETFCFDQLPYDHEQFLPVLQAAMHRVPLLADVGIQTFFNGPESFTPDNRYLLGEAPEVRNFYVAAGFNSVGIQSAGGAGKALAEWIVGGEPPMDLWDVDIRRMAPFQGNRRYLRDRTTEALGLLYAMHWPHRQYETARGARRSPLHGQLATQGACFGEAAGWERPNWYAPAGEAPAYRYSYRRQNWFAHSAAEHQAVRTAVGLFDQSSFAKFLVQGPDAEAVLQRVCANDVAVEPGCVVYTPWLNAHGGIEADLTVTRLDEERYLVVTSGAAATHNRHWLERHMPGGARAYVTDVTSAYAVLGLMGPQSRDLLAGLCEASLDNAAFPFGTAREVELGYARVWALRITYVGELGWELYVPSEFAPGVLELLLAHGERHGLRLAGMHAQDSCRLEKGYRRWGHDVTSEDTALEAGLGFACALDKDVDFVGRQALLRQREQGLTRRLVQFALEDAQPLLYHNEPVYRDGELVGRLTSGNYGHALGRAVGMGYVACADGVDAAFVRGGRYEIEIACERHAARASLRPFYDPGSERVRV